MKGIKAILQPLMLQKALDALHVIEGLPAVTVSDVHGIDTARGSLEQVTKTKLKIMVPAEIAARVLAAIQAHAHTSKAGDGRVFVVPIEENVSTRNGERSEGSL
jgi:nitrogen regulatory protein PII